MPQRLFLCAAFGVVLSLLAAFSGEANEDARRASGRAEVYKTTGDAQLQLFVFEPPGHRASDKRPAIVFFFGGGWAKGTVSQFEPHAQYFASRGMVAITVDYRVHGRHKNTIAECVADAKSAIRYVRANAARLGVDPDRIVSAGGSAGGHLAGAVAVIEGFDETGEDASIGSRSNALVLFNPVLDLRAEAYKGGGLARRVANRLGAEPERLSLTPHVRKGAPPAIALHGTHDETVPFAQAKAFTQAMRNAGSRCELISYEKEEHGFFNLNRSREQFVATVEQVDKFLASLGYLEGKPTIQAFAAQLD